MGWGITRKQIVMLAVLMSGTFVTVLNQTVMTPALPFVMEEMNVDASTAQWLTTGFTLVNAIMIPITAWLIDKFPTRTLFMAALTSFALGSLTAAISPNFLILLVGRLLQAAGAGVLMPMVQTVMMRTFPVERRGSAMGMFGLIIAFAPAIGPTVSGLVIDFFGWRVMFVAITVLVLIVILISPFVLTKEDPADKNATLDKPSVLLSTCGFGAMLYGFSAVGSYGLSAQAIIACIAGVVILVFFFRRQLRLEKPMLNVRVLQNKTFLMGTVIAMFVQGSLLAAGVLMPIYLQTLMGYSATTSGLVILPGAVIMGIMGPIAGRWFDKYGARVMGIIGMTILTLSTLAFAMLTDTTSLTYLTVLYAVRMFSLSLVNMPITTWAMNSLSNEVMNHGTSVNNTFRQVAGSLGTAILVSVYTLVGANFGGESTIQTGIVGMNAAFATGAGLCLIGLVLTIIFVKDAPKQATDEERLQNRNVLESIMQRDVYTIDSHATVLEAMQMLVEKGISAAPVVDSQGVPRGFISDGDIMRHLSKRSDVHTDPILFITQAHPDDTEFDEKIDRIMQMEVKYIDARGVISVDIHDDLPTICRVLGDHHLKKAVVLDEGKIAGVVNRSDLIQYSMRSYLERTGQSAQLM